jgi:hypothetical protein
MDEQRLIKLKGSRVVFIILSASKDNVYLPSELIDNCPLYGGFSNDLYENAMPAARVRQCDA